MITKNATVEPNIKNINANKMPVKTKNKVVSYCIEIQTEFNTEFTVNYFWNCIRFRLPFLLSL